MRENRPSGSEGGGAETNRLFLPLYTDLQNQPSLPRLTDGCADGHGFEKPG